jgi:hypothetical protein
VIVNKDQPGSLKVEHASMEEHAMKTSATIALCITAFAASTADAHPARNTRPVLTQVQYVQPICRFPARWIWRGFWSCEYPAPVFYPRQNHGYYGGGHYGGSSGHFSGGRGHAGGLHGGHR